MSDRKNIKVDAETFERMKERKPKGVTWDYYLRREVLGERDEDTERMKEMRKDAYRHGFEEADKDLREDNE